MSANGKCGPPRQMTASGRVLPMALRETSMPTMRKFFSLAGIVAAIFASKLASPQIVVPLKLSEHLAIVVAKIDGTDVPLLLDSGDQSPLALRQSVLDQVRAVPTSQSFTGQDVKGTFEAPKYRVSDVQIGRASFRDILARAEIHSPANRPVELGQEGILGTGLLKSYKVVIDYPHQTMTLLPVGSASKLCQGTSVPFAPLPPNNQAREPLTETETDIGPVTLWWDTGAQASVIAKTFAEQGHAKLAEDGSLTTRRLTLGGTDFGPWRFETMDISLPPFFNGFIGYDFFAHHVVCFDFPNKQLLIQR